MDATQLLSAYKQSLLIIDRYRTIDPVPYPSLSDLVDSYCSINGISIAQAAKSGEHKRILLAICIKRYHPEKLEGTHIRRLRNGIISGLSYKLGVLPNYFKNNSESIIFQYTEIQSFRSEIDNLLKILL